MREFRARDARRLCGINITLLRSGFRHTDEECPTVSDMCTISSIIISRDNDFMISELFRLNRLRSPQKRDHVFISSELKILSPVCFLVRFYLWAAGCGALAFLSLSLSLDTAILLNQENFEKCRVFSEQSPSCPGKEKHREHLSSGPGVLPFLQLLLREPLFIHFPTMILYLYCWIFTPEYCRVTVCEVLNPLISKDFPT